MGRCVLQNVACSVFVSTTNSNKKKEDNMIVLYIIRTMYDTLGVYAINITYCWITNGGSCQPPILLISQYHCTP